MIWMTDNPATRNESAVLYEQEPFKAWRAEREMPTNARKIFMRHTHTLERVQVVSLSLLYIVFWSNWCQLAYQDISSFAAMQKMQLRRTRPTMSVCCRPTCICAPRTHETLHGNLQFTKRELDGLRTDVSCRLAAFQLRPNGP